MPTTHIRNLTDVDDKTIRDSQKAGVSLAEFTAGWADLFHRDCAALNCLPPHAEPSAVGHIPEQIRMVQTLVEKGHAYVSEDGSVYFRISSFPEYGRLSHLDERELDLGKTANTRSNADEYERIPWQTSCYGRAAGRKTATTSGPLPGEKAAPDGIWNAPP